MTENTVIECLIQLFTVFGMPAFSLVSRELRAYLTGKGVALSHTTAYNPAGNGQVEKYNGVVWKAVTMACKSKNLPIKYWQNVLPDVLHSIRSLLCTATNETPHEWLFYFSRRSTSGNSIPTWLTTPGPVLLKRHVRTNKMEPLVDEVELLEANPSYAHIRYPDRRNMTVSTKHLAPCGEPMDWSLPQVSLQLGYSLEPMSAPPIPTLPSEMEPTPALLNPPTHEVPLRRSEHIRHPVDYLTYKNTSTERGECSDHE